MSVYSFDVNKAINRLIPQHIRYTAIKEWLEALLSPVATLYSDFLTYEAETNYDLRVTAQVMVLEQHLNLLFTPSSATQAIFIENVETYADALEFGQAVEEVFAVFGQSGETERAEIPGSLEDNGFDFIVWYPISTGLTQSQLDQLIGEVNKYKLAGTNFIIRSY